ncbi:MAG: hypothetical protein E7187_03680 [Erysipelotrichaceae bacterium]|nr:hypothetical protein [Erysipelotrichaceae bacterium]MBR2745902.1 peptidylprolyl isomerase [Erysipelotrichaceae bacterium]
MVEKLKEYWFPLLVGIFFVCVSIFFAYDQNKGKLPGKTVNGQQIVFSVDDTNYSADQLYDDLSKVYHDDRVATMFQVALLDSAIKSTDEFKAELDKNYQNTVAAYQQYYGYDVAYLDNIAKTYYGYDTFYEYMNYSTKAQKLYTEYFSKNGDKYFTEDFQKEYKPRIVSYVVLTLDDPENPTAEETAKVKAAQDAWASSEYSADNFADFAKKYSEDGNASTGGVFGYLDTKTSGIDEVFLNTALALEEGQVSEWTFSETFGYYLIKVDSVKFDDIKNETAFANSIMSSQQGLSSKILWETANELGVTFGSDEIKNIIMKSLNVESED